jgi:uncharacterized protein (TIGR02246 family)
MSGEVEGLDARLRRLEDLEEIRQLFVDYGHHLDKGDFAAYSQLFAADSEVLLGPMGRARGPEAIRALMEKALAGRAGDSYHLIANPIVQLDGDGARSEVTWAVVTRRDDGSPALTMLGRHRDVLVRERGRWRFKRREGLVDIPSRFPGS